MTVSVLDRPRAETISLAAWLGRANGIALWSVVFLLVVYPLFMVLAAALAPAFPSVSAFR